jgi:hypothetical protein
VEEVMIEQIRTKSDRKDTYSPVIFERSFFTGFLGKMFLSLLLVMALICSGTQELKATSEAQTEKKGLDKSVNEEAPFITEVMTKEELQT